MDKTLGYDPKAASSTLAISTKKQLIKTTQNNCVIG